jgi:hypothetical protein
LCLRLHSRRDTHADRLQVFVSICDFCVCVCLATLFSCACLHIKIHNFKPDKLTGMVRRYMTGMNTARDATVYKFHRAALLFASASNALARRGLHQACLLRKAFVPHGIGRLRSLVCISLECPQRASSSLFAPQGIRAEWHGAAPFSRLHQPRMPSRAEGFIKPVCSARHSCRMALGCSGFAFVAPHVRMHSCS